MSKTRGGGPGTSVRNGVQGTLDAPFAKAASSRPSNHMKAPFDHAPSAGGIPVKMYDDLGGMSSKTPSQVAPSQQGGKREGTKEYPYGGGSMRDGRSK